MVVNGSKRSLKFLVEFGAILLIHRFSLCSAESWPPENFKNKKLQCPFFVV
jgi:hypothetical protein